MRPTESEPKRSAMMSFSSKAMVYLRAEMNREEDQAVTPLAMAKSVAALDMQVVDEPVL